MRISALAFFRRSGLFVAVAIVAVVWLAACADPPAGQPDAQASEAFMLLAESALASAEETGASNEQVEILHNAMEAGEMSHALARQALDAFVACLADSHIGFDDVSAENDREYPRIEYRVYADDTTAMDLCYDVHYGLVDSVYQLQPQAVEETESLMVDAAPAITLCLEGAGFVVPSDPNYDELRAAAYFAWNGVYPGESFELADPGFVAVDCLAPAGLDVRDLSRGVG